MSHDNLLLITGLAGAGRTLAGKHLEDLGWSVCENPPQELVGSVAALSRYRLAVSVGSRAAAVLSALRTAGADVRTLFLEATPEILVRRFEHSRRPHPLSDGGRPLLAAIERERRQMQPVREEADILLDTSELNTHQLRSRLGTLFGPTAADTDRTQVTLMSFGFKHGLPLDADLVLDCRFLPNPHWVEELRPQTGREPAVRDYVLGLPAARDFADDVTRMLRRVLPAFAAERKPYLTVALGCTGGRHRSVVMTEHLAGRLRDLGYTPGAVHRDVTK